MPEHLNDETRPNPTRRASRATVFRALLTNPGVKLRGEIRDEKPAIALISEARVEASRPDLEQ